MTVLVLAYQSCSHVDDGNRRLGEKDVGGTTATKPVILSQDQGTLDSWSSACILCSTLVIECRQSWSQDILALAVSLMIVAVFVFI